MLPAGIATTHLGAIVGGAVGLALGLAAIDRALVSNAGLVAVIVSAGVNGLLIIGHTAHDEFEAQMAAVGITTALVALGMRRYRVP